MSWPPSNAALELRPLSSTGITRPPRYYGPLRHPGRPDPSLAGCQLARATPPPGLPVLPPSSSSLRAAATTPAEPVGVCVAHFPTRWQPSPLYGRVGFRISCFEACSAFPRIAARMVAESPKATRFIEVLQSKSLPPSTAPTATGWSDSCRAGFAPAEGWRLVTAHHIKKYLRGFWGLSVFRDWLCVADSPDTATPMKRPPESAIPKATCASALSSLSRSWNNRRRGSPSWSRNWPAARDDPVGVPGPPRRNRALPPRRRTDASRRRSSGRSPGGQPGHEGHGRSWVSVEQVDQLIPVKPSTCHRCGHRLSGHDPHPQRHQEVVLPPVQAQIIEYQLHTLRCRHCDRLTEAGWPEGVSRHTFGPSVQALGGPAGRGLPAEQAHYPGAVVRRLRPGGVAGYGQPTGTGGGRGPGGCGRGGARLRSPTGNSQRRRDRLAPAPRQGLIVDRRHGRRHRVRHSPKPWTRRGR